MNILFTAFGPFDKFAENPSQLVLEELERISSSLENNIFSYDLLDVSFSAIDRYQINATHDFIIHMGVATGSKHMRFELMGKNEKEGKDVDGLVLPKGPIFEGQSNIQTSFPLSVLENIVEKYKNEVVFSEDAGNYLCNYVYFNSLLSKRENTVVLFIHIADFQHSTLAPSCELQAKIILELIRSIS